MESVSRMPKWHFCLSLMFFALATKLVNSLFLVSGVAILFRTAAILFVLVFVVLTIQDERLFLPAGLPSLGLASLLLLGILSAAWTIAPSIWIKTVPDLLLHGAFFIGVVGVTARVNLGNIIKGFLFLNFILLLTTIAIFLVFGTLRSPELRATPLVFALYASMLAPICFTEFVTARTNPRRALGAAFFTLDSLIIVLSASRTGLLIFAAYGAVFVIAWAGSTDMFQDRLARTAKVALVSLPILGLGIFTVGGDILIRRSLQFFNRLQTVDFTGMARFEMAIHAFEILNQYPLFGIGLQSFRTVSVRNAPVHNFVLDAWVSFGFLGLIAALLFTIGTIRLAIQLSTARYQSSANHAQHVAISTAGVGVVLIWSTFQGNVANSVEIYFVGGLLFGLSHDDRT